MLHEQSPAQCLVGNAVKIRRFERIGLLQVESPKLTICRRLQQGAHKFAGRMQSFAPTATFLG